MTEWEAEGGYEEVRFTIFNVPHVIKKHGQYLVYIQGLPPQRRIVHIALLKNVEDHATTDGVVDWVKRSGLFGLMSRKESTLLSSRLEEWWKGPDLSKPLRMEAA